jgi:hypothetical protein
MDLEIFEEEDACASVLIRCPSANQNSSSLMALLGVSLDELAKPTLASVGLGG